MYIKVAEKISISEIRQIDNVTEKLLQWENNLIRLIFLFSLPQNLTYLLTPM